MAKLLKEKSKVLLELKGISKGYLDKDNDVIDNLDLSIEKGEIFCLLGASGCGKSTLLKIIAGLSGKHIGQVYLSGEDITSKAPNHRDVNMMFQSYFLFPHLNVYQNIAFGLKRAGVYTQVEIEARVTELLGLLKLTGKEKKKADELSGGEQQRVALARALARRPKLILLDEPLAALDKKLREQTILELKKIQKQLDISFLVVTHDQDEAMALADKMAIMVGGKLLQVGEPREIYNNPRSRYVAEFLGSINCFDIEVGSETDKAINIKLSDYDLKLTVSKKSNQIHYSEIDDTSHAYCVRPEKMMLSTSLKKGEKGILATIERINYLGNHIKYFCKSCGTSKAIGEHQELEVLLSENDAYHKESLMSLKIGSKVYIKLPENNAIMFINAV